MGAYVVRRLVQFSLVIGVASLVVFITLYVAADPVSTMLPIGTSEEVVERFREDLGMNDPVLERFGSFVADAVRGDFGESTWLGTPAFAATLERVPATAVILLPATLLGLLVGSAFGILAATRPGSWWDNLVNALSFAAISMAEFWLASMLVLLFAVQLDLLPTSGRDGLASYVLPVSVLAIRPMAYVAQMMRTSMVAESGRPYVTTARAKGLGERAVDVKHKLRNASIPVITLAIYDLGNRFVGAAVVVEIVFAWPGFGRLAVGALEQGDLFLVQSVVFVAAVVTAGLNLIADLLLFTLDPRSRQAVISAKARR